MLIFYFYLFFWRAEQIWSKLSLVATPNVHSDPGWRGGVAKGPNDWRERVVDGSSVALKCFIARLWLEDGLLSGSGYPLWSCFGCALWGRNSPAWECWSTSPLGPPCMISALVRAHIAESVGNKKNHTVVALSLSSLCVQKRPEWRMDIPLLMGGCTFLCVRAYTSNLL